MTREKQEGVTGGTEVTREKQGGVTGGTGDQRETGRRPVGLK